MIKWGWLSLLGFMTRPVTVLRSNASKGVPLLNVSWLLGHSSTKMTERYYTHTDVGRLKTDIINPSLKEATVTNVSPGGKAVL